MMVGVEHPPYEGDQVIGSLRKTPPLLHLLDHLRQCPAHLEEVLPPIAIECHNAAEGPDVC